nr:helix-turn-helix domain-containing protein [uncultured Cohaesibacter sp.]
MNSMEIFQNGDPSRPWTVYDDIAEHCGKDIAIAMFEEFAGIQIKIPRTVDTPIGRTLSNAIGNEAVKKLCETFPGDSFYLPQQGYSESKGRKGRIIKLLLSGDCTTLDIARIEGVSERYVRMVRSKYRKAHPNTFSDANKAQVRPVPTQ